MLESLKTWYAAYGTLSNFFEHKVTHFIAGFVWTGASIALGHGSVLAISIGLIGTLVLAIGKEIADHIQLIEDPTNPIDGFIYHVYDVIVTVLGGVFGLVVLFIVK